MNENNLEEVTQLLQRWSKGDTDVNDQLFNLIHSDLRRHAQKVLGQYASKPYQATDLVHDAYIRLVKSPPKDLKSRRHFFNTATQVMRRVLFDYIREQQAHKRGSGKAGLTLITGELGTSEIEPLPLLEGIEALRKEDERKALVVHARYFWGFSIEDVATMFEISTPTVKRDWKHARAFLYDFLQNHKPSTS